CRVQFVQEREPFSRKLHADVADPGHVATRPVEAGNEARFDRSDSAQKDDWYRRSCRFSRKGCDSTARCDDKSHLPLNQLRRQRRKALVTVFAPAKIDRNIVTFRVSGFAQAL